MEGACLVGVKNLILGLQPALFGFARRELGKKRLSFILSPISCWCLHSAESDWKPEVQVPVGAVHRGHLPARQSRVEKS